MTIEEMGRTRASGRRVARAGALVALAAGATLLVAACSSGSAAGASGAASTAATTATPATAAPAAATADTLGDYGRSAATQPPAASAEPEGGEPYEVGIGTNAATGSFLTGEGGMTLYIFEKDSPGKTVCYDQCAVNWPPFTVKAGETVTGATGIGGTFGTITRTDGSTQVTYRDQPLYYYVADRAAGDVNGQGVGGVWFVAAP